MPTKTGALDGLCRNSPEKHNIKTSKQGLVRVYTCYSAWNDGLGERDKVQISCFLSTVHTTYRRPSRLETWARTHFLYMDLKAIYYSPCTTIHTCADVDDWTTTTWQTPTTHVINATIPALFLPDGLGMATTLHYSIWKERQFYWLNEEINGNAATTCVWELRRPQHRRCGNISMRLCVASELLATV